jgi:hypothetical protein
MSRDAHHFMSNLPSKISPIPKTENPNPIVPPPRGTELFKDSVAGRNPLHLDSVGENRFHRTYEDPNKFGS